jgi:hypothetical protein
MTNFATAAPSSKTLPMTRRKGIRKTDSDRSFKRRRSKVTRPAKPQRPSLSQSSNLSTLGRKLLEIRRRIIASGQPLLTMDEIDRELNDRRGQR